MNKNPVSNAVKGSYRDADDKLIEGMDASQDYIWAEYPLGRCRSNSTVYINANSIHFTFQYLRAMALAYQSRDIRARGDLNAYQDGSSVQAWAKEAMQWAVAKGLISGKSGARLDPSGSAVRAEAAAVLVRFLRQS